MRILNLRMMSHPLNWVMILVMWMFAGYFGALIIEGLHLPWWGSAAGEKRRANVLTMPAGQAPGEERAGAIEPQMASLGF